MLKLTHSAVCLLADTHSALCLRADTLCRMAEDDRRLRESGGCACSSCGCARGGAREDGSASSFVFVYSVYLLYKYKRTNTDAAGAQVRGADESIGNMREHLQVHTLVGLA